LPVDVGAFWIASCISSERGNVGASIVVNDGSLGVSRASIGSICRHLPDSSYLTTLEWIYSQNSSQASQEHSVSSESTQTRLDIG